MKRRVAIGFLGTVLDARPRNGKQKWRPTLALCQQPGLFIDRLELLHDPDWERLATSVTAEIGQLSPATEVRRHALHIRDPWDFSEMYSAMRDFAASYPFDTEREDYLVNITTGTHVAQICWFLVTEANFVPGKLIQLSPGRSEGSGDDTASHAGKHSIIDLDLSRYDDIATRFAAERMAAASFLKSGIETRNRTFNGMIDEIEQVAIRSRAPVLLTGPTGAGKSQLARRIYELKKSLHQVSGTFVEVNCATLRGDHAMSTLFGHTRGAFTGATSDRAGLMKAADGGVLFLDEIGELGLDEQAMCLRAIEEKRFLPVGSDREATSDFQLIAGTNRDLWQEVRLGRFREDLFARLNLWTFRLPGLADRREDLEPNIHYELQRLGRQDGQNYTINREALERYLGFARSPQARWTGNFRDLTASMLRMVTLSEKGRITEATVQREIDRLTSAWSSTGERPDSDEELVAGVLGPQGAQDIDPFDLPQLAAVIRACRAAPSLSEAGRMLFACSRLKKTTGNDADRLRKYLQKFGLRFQDLTLG